MTGSVAPGTGRATRQVPRLSRNRDFNLLWAGQALSDLGSWTTLLAVPLLVLSVTGSPTEAGAVGTVSAVVRALGRLPGGALADRWNRRAVLLTCDAARLVLMGTLAAAIWLDRVSFGLLLAVVVLTTVFDVAFSPTALASVSRLVPAERLPDAFARNEVRSYGVQLAGPPLGGVLFAVSRAVPFVFDAATYLCSLVTIAWIRGPLTPEVAQAPQQSIAGAIAEGLRHVWSDRFLRALLLVAAPLNFAVTGALFTMTMTLREAGLSAGLIGVAQAVTAVGGLVGALFSGRLQRRATLRRLVVLTDLGLLVCIAAASLATSSLVVAVPLALGLSLAPAANAALFARLGATTPAHLQGRVLSVVFLAATGTASLAPLVTGALVEQVGGATAMSACVLTVGLSGLAAVFHPGLARRPASLT